LLDWVTWGGWFHSAFAYLEHNLGPEPERFGAAPFEYYASVLSTAMAAPTAFLAVLSVAGVVRAPGLFSVAVLVVLAYSAVPHKEFRFIFPALPLFCALAGIGLDQIGKTAQKRMSIEPPVNLKWVTPTLAVCVLVSAALSAATFHALTFRDLGQLDPRLSDASAYDSGGDINRLHPRGPPRGCLWTKDRGCFARHDWRLLLLGDDVTATRLEEERDGAVERCGSTGVGLVHDPFAIVDLHPVPHRVAEERASHDAPRERDASWAGGARGRDRKALRTNAEPH